jgi:glycosyltransferase involved in cell wall biosynthesis
MKPNILFLCPVPFFKGGAEKSLIDLINNDQINPILVVPSKGPIHDFFTSKGVTVETVDMKSVGQIRRPFFFAHLTAVMDAVAVSYRISEIAKKYKCGILHSNGLKMHILSLFVKLFVDVKVVLHIRDCPFTWSEKLVWRLMGIFSDKLILVSRACWPFQKASPKMKILFNAVNKSNYHWKKSNRSKIRKLGFIGRIHQSKGIDLVIEWLKEYARTKKYLTFRIIGEACDDQLEYLNQLKKMIHEAGLDKHVQFVKWQNHIDTIFSDLDVVIVPSYIPDSLPRVVMESMAMKIPVLAYPAGGLLYMIEDRETGLFVKNYGDFSDAITYLNDKKQYDKIVHNAYACLDIKFSFTGFYNRLNQFYAELTA